MTDIDDKIRAALRQEEDVGFEDDQNVFQMMADTFRGKNRWLVVLFYLYTFAFFALGIFCAVRFFGASGDERILWAVGFTLTMMLVAQLKAWYWMQLNRNTILREIKRLELRIVALSEELSRR